MDLTPLGPPSGQPDTSPPAQVNDMTLDNPVTGQLDAGVLTCP